MKIRFLNLQENLRANLWARIDQGQITGKAVAREVGFQQAHLSNFLNGRRGLSLQSMDRLLDVLHMDVIDLTGLNEARMHLSNSSDSDKDHQVVAVVPLHQAGDSVRFNSDQIQDTQRFPKQFLRRLKPRTLGNRRGWTRFVVVPVDEESARCMSPLLKPGALLLVDRHYNWPTKRSVGDKTMYVVRLPGRCVVRYVTELAGNLVLVPENRESKLENVPVPAGRKYVDFIVGRVCHLAMEM